MHTFSDNYTLGKFNPPSYANWLAELRALFPIPDEQAYERFDAGVSAEA